MLIEKVTEAVEQMIEKHYKENLKTGEPELILRIHPGEVGELYKEFETLSCLYMVGKGSVRYVCICGLRIPIVIDSALPKDVKFMIQTREDYTRYETIGLLDNIRKMFQYL